jgi:hypothetical protein
MSMATAASHRTLVIRTSVRALALTPSHARLCALSAGRLAAFIEQNPMLEPPANVLSAALRRSKDLFIRLRADSGLSLVRPASSRARAAKRCERCYSNGMDAPTRNGISVPKWSCVSTTSQTGAPIMKATTIGIDLAKNLFVRPASRVSFCFTGAGIT